MDFIVDIAFIALVVFFVVSGAKKGFIRALLDGFSSIISGVLSYALSKPVADFVYNSFIRGFTKEKMQNVLSGSYDDFDSVSERVTTLIGEIPEGAINLASKFGFNIEAVTTAIIKTNTNDKDALVEAVMVNVADNVLLRFTEAIMVIVLFLIVSLILSFVIRIFDASIDKIPVIKETNKISGAVLGLVKAVVVIFVVCTLLFFVVSSSENAEFVTVVSSSKIYGFINSNNPLLNIFN